MGNIQGFEKGFVNSKVASHKVMSDSKVGTEYVGDFGKNTNKTNIGMSSNSKASIDPTSDTDDNSRAKNLGAPQANGDEPMTPSSRGGASGDGATPGYSGSGSGIAELNSAHGNDAKRSLNYGN